MVLNLCVKMSSKVFDLGVEEIDGCDVKFFSKDFLLF